MREMSIRAMGGTCSHGPLRVILHLLQAHRKALHRHFEHLIITTVQSDAPLPRPSPAPDKIFDGFVTVERPAEGKSKG